MLKKVKHVIKSIVKRYKGNKIAEDKRCPVCKQNTYFKAFPYNKLFNKLYKHGFVHSPFQFETLNLEHYHCAKCGANDRDRLIALYLTNYFNEISNRTLKLIDFAPVKPLQKFIKHVPIITYRSADLLKNDVDDKVDMTNMTIYKTNTFDVFICSHILEHIIDDSAAIKELYRITNNGGIGLCLVPILLSLDKSLENEAYRASSSLRWKYFGQGDHVRMYAKNDFVSRLSSVGFKVDLLDINYFGEQLFEKSGIDSKSVLYVVRKSNHD